MSTVFILGAGASKEVELPTGPELTGAIAKLLDLKVNHSGHVISGEPQIYAALRAYVERGDRRHDLNHYLQAARRIAEAMPLASSIDNFIDGHRGNHHIELCGKLAIVLSILNAERRSTLYVDHRRPDVRLNLAAISQTWFTEFWRLLSVGATGGDLLKRAATVEFVSFNYDRCVEQFLFHAAQMYYGMNQENAVELVSAVKIYHPYGSIGLLPWTRGTPRCLVGYGDETSHNQLIDLAGGIKTFTQSVEGGELVAMRKSLNRADLLVFLGFAYHRQNMDVLWPEKRALLGTNRRFIGTAFEVSKGDRQIIGDDIQDRSGISHVNGFGNLYDLKCAKLFQENRRTLSLM